MLPKRVTLGPVLPLGLLALGTAAGFRFVEHRRVKSGQLRPACS